MIDSGGSRPCCTSSAGTELMTVKVAAWASRTSPSSSPRNICPPSMGCLSSHMADRDSSATSRSLAFSSSLDSSTSSMAPSTPRPIM